MGDHPSNQRLRSLLGRCSPEQLEPLYVLLTDSVTGRPTDPDDLAEDLRKWGSNTLVTWFWRWNEGVTYQEVTEDVASTLKVHVPPGGDERDIEVEILKKVVATYVEKEADAQEREDIRRILEAAEKDGKPVASHVGVGTTSVATSTAVVVVGRKAAQQVLTKVLQRILAGQVGKQAVRQGVKTFGRYALLAMPFVNVVMAAWLVLDIAGPAYRKTIPAVINVALLRLEVEEGGN